jgi:hypothetical protein
MPLTNINILWFKGIGYDITIGEDVRGDPYILIAINRIGSNMKLQEITNSWKGKTIKITGTAQAPTHFGGKIQKAVDKAGQTRIHHKTDLKNLACAR